MNQPWTKLGLFVICIGLLNLAAINKKENPIVDTQTSPIKYEDKMKEVKDGNKEAPKPTYEFHKKEEFLTEPNLADDKKEDGAMEAMDKLPMSEDQIPEDLTGMEDMDEDLMGEDMAGEDSDADIDSEDEALDEDWWGEDLDESDTEDQEMAESDETPDDRETTQVDTEKKPA